MITLIKAIGQEEEVKPTGKKFSLDELQKFVGGYIDIIKLPSGRFLYINDEGKLLGLPINEKATKIWKEEYPIDKFPFNNDELVVGDVLLMDAADDEAQQEEECPECGGTGKITILSQVYPGEPHMADLGDSRPCICQIRDDDMSGASEGER